MASVRINFDGSLSVARRRLKNNIEKPKREVFERLVNQCVDLNAKNNGQTKSKDLAMAQLIQLGKSFGVEVW